MKSIDADIKNGKLKNIYFLIGVEPYLIGQYRDKLKNALIGGDDDLNCRHYNGEAPDINEVIEYADTVPFFSDRRLVILEDTGLFKSSDGRLADYLKDLPETTYFIFVECYKGDKSDEKKYENTLVNKKYKLYKTVKELGRIVEFPRTGDDLLIKWILKKFKDAGLNITRNAMDCFMEYAGNDMTRLSNEAEKLICFRLGHSTIDVDDVKAICSKTIENNIFEMVSAIASKDKRKAFRLYYDLMELKVKPISILPLIAKEFDRLSKVKAIKGNGGSQKDVTELTGIHPYYAGKYMALSARFTSEYLKGALDDCIESEHLFKQGRLNDAMAVEMLLIKYSS